MEIFSWFKFRNVGPNANQNKLPKFLRKRQTKYEAIQPDPPETICLVDKTLYSDLQQIAYSCYP